ncbi:hypothetical protein GCM10011344_32710 [Dokdonia pacifica]|uniref:Uncharacterized protein n=1 Tax=Dokdonia pacifica TaxID=1627892 RepID=A0A239BHG7_9FLAO|nr:hypothetical protein [Dokdonia pacifica]GGG29320.1 hypothetical protein GCM10011344_32710 [Dokdonia pacifica]SNS07545.1 hypothetical protein SAMN06265376_106192 [Dokdonia pacifica]
MADLFKLGKVKIFLDFISDGHGRVQIAEPVGFDSLNPTLEKDDNRLGIDVFFAGGVLGLEFYANQRIVIDGVELTHQFDRLINNWKTYGAEAEIKFIVEIDGIDKYSGELDFDTGTETDYINFIKCGVLQDTLQAVVKRRSGVKVDLFSDEDLDGNTITPLTTTNVLLKATPERLTSEWVSSNEEIIVNFNVSDPSKIVGFVPFPTKFEIQGTKSPFFGISVENSDAEKCVFLTAETNLSNVVFNIEDFTYSFSSSSSQNYELVYRKGVDFSTAEVTTVTIPSGNTDASYEFGIGKLDRGESFWCYIGTFAPTPSGLVYTLTSVNTSITSISTAIDSITQSFRFIDIMRQVVKSVSGADIVAPRFDVGGEFYNDFTFNGILIRGITDRAFNISIEDIVEQLAELNGDFQIRPDGTVFFGIYDDFYPDNEIADLTSQPFTSYRNKLSPKASYNQIVYKYKNYEKGRNEDAQNSLEGIHTECQMLLPNIRNHDIIEVEVPFSRDPFLIEKIRLQGIQVSDNTAKEDDDDFFMIDVYEETSAISKSEGMVVNMVVINTTVLELSNDGSFSFNLLGGTVNDQVSITGENNGNYIIVGFSPQTISLAPVTPTPNPTFTGVTRIVLNYNVTATNLVTATNQDFDFISGTTDPTGFANMRYSTKQNIINRYGKHLKTSCQRHPTGVIKNIVYRHNGEFQSRRTGSAVTITEDQDIDVNTLPTAILKDTYTITQVQMDIEQAFDIIYEQQMMGGWLKVLNPLQEIEKIHATNLEYDVVTGLMSIEGDERI